jgi:hypothetical protein
MVRMVRDAGLLPPDGVAAEGIPQGSQHLFGK